jgi:hypothetical protein
MRPLRLFRRTEARWLPARLVLLMIVGRASAAETFDFVGKVAPILQRHCIGCHSASLEKGGVSLATSDSLLELGHVVPGKPSESYLLELLTGADDQPPRMPQDAPPLSAEEVAIIREWIAQGAAWPQGHVVEELSRADASWWSLQPLTQGSPPDDEALPAAWRENPLDRFVYASLAHRGLHPNPPADRVSLIRRATYDLTGLPPTPAEVEQFVHDPDPGAYPRLIDRLLASPRYGEHWGRHWLDVIRFGESRGYERNEIINSLWPLRDFVIGSFNRDKPFDQLIREHLAGDVVAANQPEAEIGSAFLVAGPYDDVGNNDAVQAAQIRANTIDEMIRASSDAFLGLTIGCARCHDHKFDPIRQADYYAWYATFAGIRHGEREVASEEERAARARLLGPLNERSAELTQRRSDLTRAILARAEARADEFAGQWTRPSVRRGGTVEQFPPAEAAWVRLVCEAVDTNPLQTTGFRIDELEVWTEEPNPRNVALASAGARAQGASHEARDFAGAYGPQLAIDGKYGAHFLSAGPELTIQLAAPATINRVVFSSARGEVAADATFTFVGEYRIEVSQDGETWREVAHGRDRQPVTPAHRDRRYRLAETSAQEAAALAEIDRQLAEIAQQRAQIPPFPIVWIGQRVAADAAGPFVVFLGGNPQRHGDPVVPASLQVLEGCVPGYRLDAAAAEGERRRALAEWIVHPDNPLTPRVLANRVWQHHFGRGIVDTPSDFGYMGGRPTHPKLLDWLARQLISGGWRLKPLHRLVMLSQTYQQSTAFRPDAAREDADARYLWRFPPRRLTAEEIRDTMLSVAGRLDLTMGGPGFRLYDYLQDNVATYIPLDRPGPATYRRAVYHHNARAAPMDLLADFDQPDCAFGAPKRDETTTPLQALTMLNHQFTLDLAAHWADRIEKEAGADPAEQIERAYWLAFSRPPRPRQSEACRELMTQHGLVALCRVLFNASEMIYLE